MARTVAAVFFVVLAVVAPAGCVVYEPAYYPAPSTYDRAWSAALGAMQDAGVQITSSDSASGVIRGNKDGVAVSVSVLRQADGRTQVRFDAKDSQRDPGLAERLSQAYDRRMGR
jgi:hypothetical protein